MSRHDIRELVIISGKGGTGKTSLTAAFASLAGRAVLADCDVDAADLHLLLHPEPEEHYEFRSGHQAVIRQEDCTRCGDCYERCRFEGIRREDTGADVRYTVDPLSCEGCGVCVDWCPAAAIDFPECTAGEWYVSSTPCGPMVHAKLGIAAENSGKLVSTVRRAARDRAEKEGIAKLIIDGPPGIGCPVIASITGTSLALIITEPTLSGQHDLVRVARLAKHFNVPVAVCVNKWDINSELTESIEAVALSMGARPVGRIGYDRRMTEAQVAGKTVLDYGGAAAEAIREIWCRVASMLDGTLPDAGAAESGNGG